MDEQTADRESDALELGDVLATLFRVIGKERAIALGGVAALAVPVTLLTLAVRALQVHALPGSSPPVVALGSLVLSLTSLALMVLNMIGTMVLHGAITVAVVERIRGRPVAPSVAVRGALKRFGPLFGTSFLYGMIAGIGLLFCAVPGVLAWVWLVVCVPVCMIEGVGPFESFQRSVELTEGNRLTVFLLALVLWLAATFFFCVSITPLLAAIAEEMQRVMQGGDPGAMRHLDDPLDPRNLASQALLLVWQIVWVAVLAVLPAVIYAKLRGLRDDVDARSVAEVFA